MHISDSFDSGNIEVRDASDASSVRLAIKTDAGGEHKQWFHFKVTGGRGQACRFVIENAGACSYPKAWSGYRACRSSDRDTWERVETSYVDGQLIIEDTPDADVVWYAYFAPYPLARVQDLIATLQQLPAVSAVTRLGGTVDGRDLECLTVGEPGEGKKVCWVFARQHPGESMASWWMEGFLSRLTDPDDALSRVLLDKAVFYVVPHMNPDGSFRGHLRCNAAGANLNREWHAPTEARSPEVLHTRNAMDTLGCDFGLDVHGDEELPYNFISGAQGIAGWSERLASLDQRFQDAYQRATPDFQQVHGYPVAAPGQANLTMATNQLAQRFDCLSMTLEMPFKDNADLPDALHGWSPERCARLGAAVLDAIAEVVDDLR